MNQLRLLTLARVPSRVATRVIIAATLFAVLLLVWSIYPSHALPTSGGNPHATLSAPDGCPRCHFGEDGPATDRACVGCHVLPGGHGPKVYDKDESHYRTPDGLGHNEAGCLDCHCIHGPYATASALSGSLLQPLECQQEALDAVDLATASHDVALSVWCTGCHLRWPEAGVDHPFAKKIADTAWEDCTSCLSCHAAGGFPHYSPGADAGLIEAGSAAEGRRGAANRLDDGVCLRCHANLGPNGPEGVGVDF